ncbi:YrdB family protein [Microbacterium sp. A82]|uniref:YrdB family protein n=1 Tax=unclassified Microbacterium TaxID=2609290 RepID=UPI003F3ED017
MSEAPDAIPGVNRPNIAPLDIIRAVILVAAIASLVLWGFAMWAFPWNLVFGIGAPLLVLVIWALFLSPRPLLRLHPFVRAVVELLIYAGVTVVWWSMDQAWVGLGFALVAVTAGLFAGRRNLQ